MPSVHRLPKKPNWICFYTDSKGKRRCKSTLTTDKREAEKVCNKVQELEDKSLSGKLTPERARRVIETTVADILESTGVASVDQKTIRDHFQSWLKAREVETSSGTFERYRGIVEQFLRFL